MARLRLTVEGQTEQKVAITLLTPWLATRGVYLAKPQLAAHAKEKGIVHRGGLGRYAPFRNDLCRLLKQDRDAYLTTMIDLYGLPRDFPRYEEARKAPDPYRRVAILEQAVAEDIGDRRLIPYIQLHEFEALLLADPEKFLYRYPEQPHKVASLVRMCADYRSSEEIDDGEQTAPSKRIIRAIEGYIQEKPTAGPIIAEQIGLDTIRARCAHFNEWLTRLESLGTTT